jgi:hypothetical protein
VIWRCQFWLSIQWRLFFFFPWRKSPSESRPPHYQGFTITLRHTTIGRTPLDEWSARRRDLYLTTYKTLKRQTSMPPAGFEPVIPARERPETDALDRAATGIGPVTVTLMYLLARFRLQQQTVTCILKHATLPSV